MYSWTVTCRVRVRVALLLLSLNMKQMMEHDAHFVNHLNLPSLLRFNEKMNTFLQDEVTYP